MRPSKRNFNQIRQTTIKTNVNKNAEGSCLIKCGDTHIICTATLEESVPQFMRKTGLGWVTAEYAMLPRSTNSRMKREASRGKQGGRTLEIQRLIGRSLRACIDRVLLGERQIIVDCDVIQADGGTRTASISGASVAMADAINSLLASGKLKKNPMKGHVAAVSVGIVGAQALCDLEYVEDSAADTDMNVVMTEDGKMIEIQGTAEGEPFSHEELMQLLALANKGIADIVEAQKAALAE